MRLHVSFGFSGQQCQQNFVFAWALHAHVQSLVALVLALGSTLGIVDLVSLSCRLSRVDILISHSSLG